MSERLYPIIRQLLSTREPSKLTQHRWELLKNRLGDLIEERMNLRRGATRRLLDPELNGPIHRNLINTLALSAGPGGFNRLRASLLDPTP